MIGPWALEVPIFEPIDYQKIIEVQVLGRYGTYRNTWNAVWGNWLQFWTLNRDHLKVKFVG
jgi:hypothetical protein